MGRKGRSGASPRRGRRGSGALLALAALMTACGDGGSPLVPEDGALFVLEVSGEEFSALVFEEAVVRDLEARMSAGTEGVVNGELRRGDGGFNEPWAWHWEPGSVEVADSSIELCDGRPSMVDADLDYWVDTVKYFCPWGATVVRRER